jgi:hypothetical protein
MTARTLETFRVEFRSPKNQAAINYMSDANGMKLQPIYGLAQEKKRSIFRTFGHRSAWPSMCSQLATNPRFDLAGWL